MTILESVLNVVFAAIYLGFFFVGIPMAIMFVDGKLFGENRTLNRRFAVWVGIATFAVAHIIT